MSIITYPALQLHPPSSSAPVVYPRDANPPSSSTPESSPRNGPSSTGWIVGSIVVVIVIVGIVGVIVRRYMVKMRRVVAAQPVVKQVHVREVQLDIPRKEKFFEEVVKDKPVSIDTPRMEKFFQEVAKDKPVRFLAQELHIFTNNYCTRLGYGGFGVVYKGQFLNGVKIAVKVLNLSLDEAAEQQFMAEVAIIGRTYHINLVRLYGFCYDETMSALVYEYMENGSLDKYLFSETHSIEWEKLYEVAIGTAKGIAYLHEECAQRIIHYDIKPGNVLLDKSFSPKVADFGLAKLCDHDRSHVTLTGYRGTPGYSAPEFLLKNFPITYKCDVYSFGMLLFEIVGRRRNTNRAPTDSSLDWFPKHVWEEYEKGALYAMAESSGIEEKDRKKAERVAMVALWCVQDSPDARPPMSVVVKMLEGEVVIMPPPKPFHYLFSIGPEVLKPPTNGSDYSISEGSNSHWYKESTPIMTKYELQYASSNYSGNI